MDRPNEPGADDNRSFALIVIRQRTVFLMGVMASRSLDCGHQSFDLRRDQLRSSPERYESMLLASIGTPMGVTVRIDHNLTTIAQVPMV